MPDTTPAIKQYQCRHIFTDGRRCASPCLRQQEFCYYHHTTRKPVANPRQHRSRRSTFHLPLPEDRSAIQSSIGQVLQRIASNDIDPRRAGLLLYGLQIASLNLPKTQPTTKAAEPQTVEEITIDPALGVLAPRAEVARAEERKSAIHLLFEKMIEENQKEDQKKEQKDTQKAEKEKPTLPQPTTIPTLQAAEACAAPLIEIDTSWWRQDRELWRLPTLHSANTKSCHIAVEAENECPQMARVQGAPLDRKSRLGTIACTPTFPSTNSVMSKSTAVLASM